MLHWIRVLMEREPKILQTITSHKGSQQGVAFGFDSHDDVSAGISVGGVDRV